MFTLAISPCHSLWGVLYIIYIYMLGCSSMLVFMIFVLISTTITPYKYTSASVCAVANVFNIIRLKSHRKTSSNNGEDSYINKRTYARYQKETIRPRTRRYSIYFVMIEWINSSEFEIPFLFHIDSTPSLDTLLYHNESLGLMLQRWSKLEKDFKISERKFDISKIPDIYDCIK